MTNTPLRHIGVCAFPFGTHAPPLLSLAKRLSTQAADIRFTFFNHERSNASLFKANDDVNEYKNLVPFNITIPEDPDGGVTNHMKPIELFIEAAPESFARAMAEAEAEVGVEISCIICDAFLWFFGDVAEEKGLPWIPLWVCSPVALSSHFYTDVIRSHFGTEGVEEDAVVKCVPGFSDIRIKDLPPGVITGDLNSPFSTMAHKMGLFLHKSTAVLLNGFDELTPIIINDLKSHLKILSFGPFPLTSPCGVQSDPHGCIAWLDQQEPKQVVYIAFGTVATPPSHELNALAEALIESGTPFLWSIKDPIKANIPSEFLAKIKGCEKLGKIVPWAPQMALLAHPAIGAFVTHCGWNSIVESMVNGVPLICRPLIGDQMSNQRIVECDMKIGTGLEGRCFTKESTISALRKVLVSDQGKEMRKNAEKLKELAETSIKADGSSSVNFSTLLELVKVPQLQMN